MTMLLLKECLIKQRTSRTAGTLDNIKLKEVLWKNGDFKEIANAVELISGDYETISSNALQGAKQFTWNKIVKKYIDIFGSINS